MEFEIEERPQMGEQPAFRFNEVRNTQHARRLRAQVRPELLDRAMVIPDQEVGS